MKKLIYYLQIVIASFIISVLGYHQGEENVKDYSNEWIVRLKGGPEVAELIAAQHDYRFIDQVTGFKDTYRFLKNGDQRKRRDLQLKDQLINDDRVIWAEQQFTKQRQKRAVIPDYPQEDDHFNLENKEFPALSRSKRDLTCQNPSEFVGESIRNILLRVQKALNNSAVKNATFNDEYWNQQWYLQDSRNDSRLPKVDHNVLPCYERGITGKGVRVSILDDGIEHTHDDLRDNYDPEISYDANDADEDPTPRYNGVNVQGTKCAGAVAMKANNVKCGVGVAFNAKIGGVRLLDGAVTDTVEGISLQYAYDKVDIYSASWGPDDDGKTVDGPARLATEAIEKGIKEGRNGKGVIYVWASGVGGNKGDSCSCDGYIGSIYTIAIGSASQQGRFPWYGEKCAATLATTYSSGAYTEPAIIGTSLNNTCTKKLDGSSASAPLAAGIIALALEINPNLTWRDVQHLIAWTSQYGPLRENPGWTKNAAGYWVNTRFGFGLMDAFGLVKVAAGWTTVPEKFVCIVEAPNQEHNILQYGSDVKLEINATDCKTLNYLEHVELQININHSRRGDLEVDLTSPSGTNIQLLSRRKYDDSSLGFRNWKLMSVLTWNENPKGVWKVTITNQSAVPRNEGRIGKFTLHLHGTKKKPKYLENGQRQYVSEYDRPKPKKTCKLKLTVHRKD